MPRKFLKITVAVCPPLKPRSLEYAAVKALAPTRKNPDHNGIRNMYIPLKGVYELTGESVWNT